MELGDIISGHEPDGLQKPPGRSGGFSIEGEREIRGCKKVEIMSMPRNIYDIIYLNYTIYNCGCQVFGKSNLLLLSEVNRSFQKTMSW